MAHVRFFCAIYFAIFFVSISWKSVECRKQTGKLHRSWNTNVDDPSTKRGKRGRIQVPARGRQLLLKKLPAKKSNNGVSDGNWDGETSENPSSESDNNNEDDETGRASSASNSEIYEYSENSKEASDNSETEGNKESSGGGKKESGYNNNGPEENENKDSSAPDNSNSESSGVNDEQGADVYNQNTGDKINTGRMDATSEAKSGIYHLTLWPYALGGVVFAVVLTSLFVGMKIKKRQESTPSDSDTSYVLSAYV